jgi:peptidoglycan/LPS O-acetylase OafA/YrhL
MPKLSSTHSAHIDYLRALAIISVFFLHYSVFFRGDTTVLTTSAWHLLWRNGYYGVTTFFVISGYLITSNLLIRNPSTSELSLFEFYKFRAARILPGVFMLLSILLLLNYFDVPGFVGGASMWKATVYVLTFRANVIWDQLILPWLILWSLAIEEVFYLRWSRFLRQSVKVDLMTKRMIHHEDTQTVHG